MNRTILVVDDDRDMVKTLCDILRRRGWDSRPAYSGEEAIAVQREAGSAVVLMDITMPGIGGVEAFRAMRASDPDLRAILMTAHASETILQDAERAGAWRVIPKPLEVSALLALLD